MDEHIDIIRPDWMSGEEILEARVRRGASGIDVQNVHGNWTSRLLQPIADPEDAGRLLYPKDDADVFFKRLPEVLHSSYLYASAPHPDDKCPFNGSDRLPMRTIDTRTAQHHR